MDTRRDLDRDTLKEVDGLLAGVGVAFACMDSDGQVRFASRAWSSLLGEGGGEPWGWLGGVQSPSHERLKAEFRTVRDSSSPAELEVSLRTVAGADAALVLAMGPVRLEDHPETAVMVLAWDVTERRRNEDRLAFMAGHDPLTGLFNRGAFLEAMERSVLRAQRGIDSVLIIFDVDRLKAHNDAFGHLAGDQALVNVALLIRRQVRATDLPARIGGDEFAVLLDDSSLPEAEAIAERVRTSAMSGEFVPGARETGLGLSAGLAVLDASTDTRAVIERADRALYAAKQSGRNRAVVWSPALSDSHAPDRVASIVREAFATDGFELAFQPVVHLADWSVAYFESLVRLRTADGRILTPGEFLPVAERLGLMARLTRRVVELALWDLAAVPDAVVSVNLSASDLADVALRDEIASIVGSAPASRGRLIFEIAETTLLGNLAAGRAWMDALGKAGGRFVLDEFGTGVGMFVLLREPHIEQVKLSRAVTRALSAQDGRHEFVLAMRDLVESQGKIAVATYLETEALLGVARRAGFEWGQGFGVGEPSPDLAALARATREDGDDPPVR